MSTRAYSRSAPDGKQSLPPLQNGLLEGAKKPELMKEEYHNKGQMAHRGAVDNDGIAGIPPIVHDVLRSPGNPLDTATRAFFEPRFGYDFSHVRVHTDEQVAESARSINALAYTVGGNIVFGEGQYAPGTAAGNMLLAHELTHVIQQRGEFGGHQLQNGMIIDQPGGVFEKEADTTARLVSSGAKVSGLLTGRDLSIQRKTPGGDTGKTPAEKEEISDVILEGFKTVAEKLKDISEIKKALDLLLDTIMKNPKRDWNRLGTGEKTAVIGHATIMGGMTAGALLSTPEGRKLLEDINLAAPFKNISEIPVKNFSLILPSGDSPDSRLFKFNIGFNADDLINQRTESRGLPRMSLSVNMQLSYDPTTKKPRIIGGNASLGIVPGLSISGGAYKDVLRQPTTVVGPAGQTAQVGKRIPALDKPQPVPDVRFMINIDLMKFKPGDLKRQIINLF